MIELPRMLWVKQSFPRSEPVHIAAAIKSQLGKIQPQLKRGQQIALGVGSRGIANLFEIVLETIRELKSLGIEPFVVPVMGSHGGATPEGQVEVLSSYGLTEASLGVPIRASLEVVSLGKTQDGIDAYCSTEALRADGILLINRIKPHTDFFGTIGSGLLKMCVIGLGKHKGAETMHLAATHLGYEHAIRTMATVIVQKAPLIGGIAVLENQYHQVAKIELVSRQDMLQREAELHAEAKALMPLLPFDEIDLLIVDELGKNISGTGMDPNVINRSIHGYDSLPIRGNQPPPFIRRIFVRTLTPETHGNAIGIGMADATTQRAAAAMDARKTSINALTALTPQSAKLPITFENDRQAIEAMLVSLPLNDHRNARIVRIQNTLALIDLQVSESLWNQCQSRSNMEVVRGSHDLQFGADHNLDYPFSG